MSAYLREFVVNSRHPDPRRVWKWGPSSTCCHHFVLIRWIPADPVDPVDPGGSGGSGAVSQIGVSFEAVLQNSPGIWYQGIWYQVPRYLVPGTKVFDTKQYRNKSKQYRNKSRQYRNRSRQYRNKSRQYRIIGSQS